MSMLEVKDLQVYYGMIQAIKGVSFHVDEGEVIALIGANGAGKTTILHTISGLLTPKAGTVTFEGADIVKIFPIEPHNISYLKNILSPISHIPFITTGGVNKDTAKELINTGALALAAGASIIPKDALENGNFNIIEEKARELISIINNA